LWQHILKCADKNCKTAHCVSSRYLLKHYTDCKELRCPICGPVRLARRP
jgi:E1A/CREB-binding protein